MDRLSALSDLAHYAAWAFGIVTVLFAVWMVLSFFGAIRKD